MASERRTGTQLLRGLTESPARALLVRCGWIAAWVVVGASYALCLVSAASFGLFLLPLPVFATVLLARLPSARSGLPAVICGLGLPVLYVAYLNRSGPGYFCTTTDDGGQICGQETRPWPWLAAGVILIVLGVVAIIAWHRHVARSR